MYVIKIINDGHGTIVLKILGLKCICRYLNSMTIDISTISLVIKKYQVWCTGKIRTSLNDKHLLKDRYKIEHVFAKIKSNNHIMVRTEKTITNYLSFIYISFLPQKMLFIYLIIIINDVNIIYNNN